MHHRISLLCELLVKGTDYLFQKINLLLKFVYSGMKLFAFSVGLIGCIAFFASQTRYFFAILSLVL